jgi:hypothetical protein
MVPSVMRRELGFGELSFPCAIATPGPTIKPVLMNIVMKSELECCIYPPYWQYPPVYRFASQLRRCQFGCELADRSRENAPPPGVFRDHMSGEIVRVGNPTLHPMRRQLEDVRLETRSHIAIVFAGPNQHHIPRKKMRVVTVVRNRPGRVAGKKEVTRLRTVVHISSRAARVRRAGDILQYRREAAEGSFLNVDGEVAGHATPICGHSELFRRLIQQSSLSFAGRILVEKC